MRLLRNKPPDEDQDYRDSRKCKLELYGVLSNKPFAVGDANDCGRQQAFLDKPKEEKGQNGSRPTNKDNNRVFGQKGVHSLELAAR